MKRYDFTITSDRGLHAQPVAALASIACKSASCVTLEYDGGEIDVIQCDPSNVCLYLLQ